MGTSEAVGYVDANGNITGWLNELAFAPVDVSPNAMEDEWSGDIGCGVKYFSQDSVIKLAPAAGISLSADLSPAEKLKEVQKLMEVPGSPAEAIYRSIGVYLGHSLACTTTSTASSTCCSWGGSCPAGAATSSWTCASRFWPTSTPRWPARSTPLCPTRRPAVWARAWPPPLCLS